MTNYSATFLALNKMLDLALRLTPSCQTKLAALAGQTLLIRIQPRIFECAICIFEDKLLVEPFTEETHKIACTVSGTPIELTKLLLNPDVTNLKHCDVHIEGNIQLLNELAAIGKSLDLDLEEQLGKIFGDSIAHLMARKIQQAKTISKQVHSTFHNNTGEYLQEEAKVLPSTNEIDDFINEVDELNLAVERLAARLIQLQKKLG